MFRSEAPLPSQNCAEPTRVSRLAQLPAFLVTLVRDDWRQTEPVGRWFSREDPAIPPFSGSGLPLKILHASPRDIHALRLTSLDSILLRIVKNPAMEERFPQTVHVSSRGTKYIGRVL